MVTNHALLAIDAIENFTVLPEHDVVVIDEAHELVDRVTSVAAAELSDAGVEAAARRCGKLVDEKLVGRLREAGTALERDLADVPAGRLDFLPETLGVSLATVRDAAAGLRRAAARVRRRRAGPGPRRGVAGRGRRAGGRVRRGRGDAQGVRRRHRVPAGRRVAGPPARRQQPPGRARGWRRWTWARCSPSGCSGGRRSRSRRRRCRWAGRSSRWPGSGACPLPGARPPGPARGPPEPEPPAEERRRSSGTRWSGPGWTSARRSTIPAAASCTSPGTCRSRAGTGWPRPT